MLPEPGIYHDISIGDVSFEIIVVTEHERGVRAATAIHTTEFGRTIGGARFVHVGDLTELGHLSKAMTEKCAAANIPAGGQKSVIIASREIIGDEVLKASILSDHVARCREEFSGVIFGPDIAVPESVQDRIASNPDLRDHVTGLSVAMDGLSIDRNGYTAAGLDEAFEVWQNATGEKLQTAVVQGFGAVGAHLSAILFKRGVRIRAICNEHGSIISRSFAGLDIPVLFESWKSGGDRAVIDAAASQPTSIRIDPDPTALFGVRADVLIPAARTSCFGRVEELEALRVENATVRDVRVLVEDMRVRLVIEGANHPLSAAAETWLQEHGVAILVDYIVNCGGLIGCWVEWECRHAGKSTRDGTAEQQAHRHIRATIQENVHALVTSRENARAAAEGIVRRNSEKLRMRAWP